MEFSLGTIKTVEVRTVFDSEPSAFTPWLEENIGVLSDRIGLQLTVQDREAGVGDFKADLRCEDESGRQVIIEN